MFYLIELHGIRRLNLRVCYRLSFTWSKYWSEQHVASLSPQ